MRWPWSSGGSDDKSAATSIRDKLAKSTPTLPSPTPSSASSTTPSSGLTWAHFGDPRNLASAVGLTAAALFGIRFYKNHLRRIRNVAYIRPREYRRRRLLGRVTSVGDADNFRLYHTPGGRLTGWGWLPGRRVPTKREELKDQTIHVRIAGVDAPELAHFGRPAQPYGEEALAFLTGQIAHRRVRVRIWRRDQYDRVVGTAYVWRGLRRRDVGLEMIRHGLATVYEAKTGAEFGGLEEKYRRSEEVARNAQKGIWSRPGVMKRFFGGAENTAQETPRQFKDRMNATEKDGKDAST